MAERGQGVWGERSFSSCRGGMARPAKEAMSSGNVGIETGGPSRE